ncbi:MAG TPA: hypothetical protein VFS89_06535 [Nitrosospira sp.]|nr:hypothetical protein [Nitrosospira sp.]
MAIGWMTALKIIPWGNVLESAPHIVKAAKHLFSAAKADQGDYASTSDPGRREGLANLDGRIKLMEERITELRQEQQSSAELIKSLAEQNALIVEAVEIFRMRLKIVLVTSIILLGILSGLVFWLIARS